MNDITDRFTKVYEYIKFHKIVKNQTNFAEKIGVSASLITDIRKNRTKPGINVIKGIISSFKEINPSWLLTGMGSMLLSSRDYPSNVPDPTAASEPTVVYDGRSAGMEEPTVSLLNTTQLYSMIASKDELLAQKEEQIIKKEDQIIKKEDQITKKEDQIAKKENQLIAKEDQLATMVKYISEKDNQIKELLYAIHDLHGKISTIPPHDPS